MSNPFPSDLLEGEVALVTGASRGIGSAIAQSLAAAGARVIGTATSDGGAAGISDALGNAGRGVVLNIADDDSVAAAIKDIQASEGTPTILVNNAGITRDNILMRMKEEEWDDVISTNLSGVYRLCKGCLRGMMKARKGRIINIASVIGVMGNAGQSNYAAAKAGIIGFSKSLAREIGSDPSVLLANQPTRGLDVGVIEYVHNQFLELRSRGVGILLFSEDLDEILTLSDRIAVIFQGEILGLFDAEEADLEKIGLLMAGVRDGD